ncbi:MAG: DUF4185 domain-containing protein [Thermoanaerobaculales bacterium]
MHDSLFAMVESARDRAKWFRLSRWRCGMKVLRAILLAVAPAATAAGASGGPQWFSAWTAANAERLTTPAMTGTSIRMIARPTISGGSVRIRLENTLGQEPVVFSAAYIGQVQSGATLAPSTNTQLTFGGQPGLTLAAGAGTTSDPTTFQVTAFDRYAVSLDVTTASDISVHSLGLVTNYMASGAHAADTDGTAFAAVPNNDHGGNAGPSFPFYWLAAVDVASPTATGTIVALGASATDGECSTRTNSGGPHGVVVPDLYNRWTDVLASRLTMWPTGQSKAVANEGIAGNRVISGGAGPPVLVRLDNDVLGRAGATHVIFFDGADDISNGASAATVIGAEQQVVDRTHAAALKIIGATITPRGQDPAWTSAMEKQRAALNDWMRNQANFDGLIDFDALMQGPPNAKTGIPTTRPEWSCFDGVHPNSDGYAAMGAFIDLSLFQNSGSATTPVPLTWIPGSTVKVEQIIGDCDWTKFDWATQTGTCVPTTSQTITRFDFEGTDLGSSFEDAGRLVFLFGDTIGTKTNYHAGDAMAWSTSTDPAAGLLINCFTHSDGSLLFVQPPGINMGADDVPNAGIALPQGTYIICNTGSDTSLSNPHLDDYSILARFDEATQSFTTGRTISTMPNGHFIFTSLHSSGSDVLMFGIGSYRASDIYLAVTPASGFESGTGTQYFTGLDNGQPTWSDQEANAVPVVQDNPTNGPAWPNDSPTAANVSVNYSSELGLWLMTYDGGRQKEATTGVYFAYAPAPWGPWSPPQLIFNAKRDNGLGVFIHDPTLPPPGDGLNGPTINPANNPPTTTRGADYGAFMIERFTTVDGNTLTISYTMSTWNPYTIVRMRSEFTIGGQVAHVPRRHLLARPH